ncbi:MAG: alkyl/aryl-sulfatase [Blastocatellia bacterium]
MKYIIRCLTLACLLIAVTSATRAQEKNLADDQPDPKIDASLTAHSRKMTQRVYKVTDNVYHAVGFAVANVTMVVGRDGVVIIDTTESMTAAEAIAAAFRKITDKPVRAVVLTHNHSDHTGGVRAFAGEEDVKAGRVAIYAHDTMLDTVISNASVVAPILGVRAIYTFGLTLEKGPEGHVNDGLGPAFVRGGQGFLAPTRTFRDTLDVDVAGLKMRLLHAPSETDDEIVAWFPALKVLQSAEVIQGETFPNVHTIRGTKYRDPVNWYRSIDMMRRLGAEHLVPSHGRPLSGKDNVAEMLTAYRDAIQYVHDQTIRWMNRGLTPDEIVEKVGALPAHLAKHAWLGEFYGTVKHSVRQIYNGYLGWFEGDPTALDPAPRGERAKRYVEMMGGRDKVLAAARAAVNKGEHQWAAELLTYVIRVNADDAEARKVKADALRQLAYKTPNINWRNWYITSARELDGTLNKQAVALASGSLASPEIIRQLPPRTFFDSLTVRLDAAKSADARLTAAFRFTDTGQTFAVEIRRGIAEVHETAPAKADVTIMLTLADLRRVMSRQTTLAQMLTKGEIKAEGDLATLARFNGYFDPPATEPPVLTAR